jgi:hypothetical protein
MRSGAVSLQPARKTGGRLLLRASVTPLVFFLSIPLAFWQAFVAQASWSLIWVGIFILGRRG